MLLKDMGSQKTVRMLERALRSEEFHVEKQS